MDRKQVEIFTDGACSGNPGPGGWAAILRYNGVEKEIAGGEESTTNNRMELTAVIQALAALKKPCAVALCSDSKYVTDAVNKGWLAAWGKNGWKKADKTPVLNDDLWKKLVELLNIHQVKFVWLKGHAEHPENERCDRLAVEQYKKLKKNN